VAFSLDSLKASEAGPGHGDLGGCGAPYGVLHRGSEMSTTVTGSGLRRVIGL